MRRQREQDVIKASQLRAKERRGERTFSENNSDKRREAQRASDDGRRCRSSTSKRDTRAMQGGRTGKAQAKASKREQI